MDEIGGGIDGDAVDGPGGFDDCPQFSVLLPCEQHRVTAEVAVKMGQLHLQQTKTLPSKHSYTKWGSSENQTVCGSHCVLSRLF